MRRKLALKAVALVIAALGTGGGCLGFMDTLGDEALVTEEENIVKEPAVEDDRIEDKHPVFRPGALVSESFGGCEVRLNKSSSVTRLDVIPFPDGERGLENRLFPTRREAVGAVADTAEVRLIPSMEVVNAALKRFNDGLYAAVELAVQEGVAGVYPSKRQWLLDMASALHGTYAAAADPARTHLRGALVRIVAGLLAGGADVSGLGLDPGVLGDAQAAAEGFLDNVLYATPIGFYTWSPELEAIFRQDRFLQFRGELSIGIDPEGFGPFAAMAAVLAGDPELAGRYERLLALYAGLTSPYASYTPADLLPYVGGVADLEDVSSLLVRFEAEHPEPYVCTGTYLAVFPASRAVDTDYLKGTYCMSGGFPEDVQLIDVLIEAIRRGELDLTPPQEAGWYDWSTPLRPCWCPSGVRRATTCC